VDAWIAHAIGETRAALSSLPDEGERR